MKNQLLAGIALGAAAVLGVAGSASAASDLVTINSTGGTNESDGLKIDIAFGQMQVHANGIGQLYSADDLPATDAYNTVSNFPIVAFKDGADITVIGNDWGDGTDFNWDSFTSESTLDGNNGTVINHLTYGSGASLVTMDYTVSYTYPNKYLNLTLSLTGVGSDFANLPYKLYWFTDAQLAGGDSGAQFGGVTANGTDIGGVRTLDSTQLQAFRQTSGQTLKWFAGQYTCPTELEWEAGDCSPVGTTNGTGNWIAQYQDFPSVASTSLGENNEGLDNGWGASSAELSALNSPVNFDMIFASCINGVEALQCAAEAGGETAPEPELASTGSNAGVVAPIAVVIALFGAFATAFAVRRRNS